jgi:hypothetical protein
VHLSEFFSVEISALTFDAEPACGFRFFQCGEVRITQIRAVARDAREQPFAQFANIETIRVNGNLIAASEGVAVVFHDAFAVTHFTENEIQGIVSFYGFPAFGIPAFEGLLFEGFDDVVFERTRLEAQLFMSNNALQLIGIGKEKLLQLFEVLQGQANKLTDLYSSAIIQGNAFTSHQNLFVSCFLSLSSCTFLSPPRSDEPMLLGLMVAEALAAVGNVATKIDRNLQLRLIAKTKPEAFAGNAVFIRGLA